MEGWLWAKTRQGLFLSMDPQGDDIRFIPAEKLIASGHDQDNRAGFGASAEEIAERIRQLGLKLDGPLRAALERLDHSFVSGVAAKAVALGESLQEDKYKLLLESPQGVRGRPPGISHGQRSPGGQCVSPAP